MLTPIIDTLEKLQNFLDNSNYSVASITSCISITKDTVIDLHGKTIKISDTFLYDSVFVLNASPITLTFKSSNGSGGIVPENSNKEIALVKNGVLNNTVTFDEGFDVDCSEFENFNFVESSQPITLNFSGANIATNRPIRAWDNINISGGSVICNGEDVAIMVINNGKLNISGGKISGGICVPEESTNVYIEMSGGIIESRNGYGILNFTSDRGSKINITGGTISVAKNGIYSKSHVNISGGKIISESKECTLIGGYGSNAVISISDGIFVAEKTVCVYLENGAKGKISGGTFEGEVAIGIIDSNSGLVEEVRGATFKTEVDYYLLYDASVKIGGVTYKNTNEKYWAGLSLNFNDKDTSKINSVFVTNGFVEVTDKFGTRTLNAGDKYEYITSFDKTIKYWQAHLCNVYGLSYRAEILGSLYFGLQTDRLILLVGNPGSGKTTLVKYLAKSFGFEDAAIIPVQPNWTDKGDLLGYYNPLEKSYMATEFLEALLKFCRLAEEQPDKLFIICLDEMNLAHIEYYFAEFLSALQTDRKITLYSETTEKNIRRELDVSGFDFSEEISLAEMNIDERKYYLELWRMHDMIKKVHAKITIPHNVKFFGTLNQDETTLDISPKVIDRSYIIRLEMFGEDLSFDGDFKNPLKYQPLKNYREKFPADIDTNNFKNLLESVTQVSYRLTKQIFEDKNFDSWQKVIGGSQLEDFIISSCILPKVRFEGDVYKMKIDALKNLCSGHELSEKILNKIDNGAEVDFWRR